MDRVAILLAFLLSACARSQAYSNGPLFAPANNSSIAVGRGSGGIVLRDINNDGHVDLVTTHLLIRKISVLPGDGEGHFARDPAHSIDLEYQPGRIALADVNNDGILDLGVASKDDEKESVNIFLGRKQGFQFASTVTVSASTTTYKPHLYFVDLNEDGKLDMATSNGRRNTIEILFGDGQGKFSPHGVVYLPPGKNYYSFDVRDMDADGHSDLVIAISGARPGEGPGHFEIRRGNGRGGFANPESPPTSVLPESRVAAIADINGDNRLDVVLTHSERRELSILLNTGKGAFTIGMGSPVKVDLPAYSVASADINRDQIADLVVATVQTDAAPFNSKIVVLTGDGHGFKPAAGSPYSAGPGAYTVTLGDVDEDGKLDIAASSFEGDSVTMLLAR